MPINMQIEYPKLVNENQSLRLENERLRDAIKEIAEQIPNNPKFALTKIIKEIVTNALKQKP